MRDKSKPRKEAIKKMGYADLRRLFDKGGIPSISGDPNTRTSATTKNHTHKVGEAAKPSSGRNIRDMREESKEKTRIEKTIKREVQNRKKIAQFLKTYTVKYFFHHILEFCSRLDWRAIEIVFTYIVCALLVLISLVCSIITILSGG